MIPQALDMLVSISNEIKGTFGVFTFDYEPVIVTECGNLNVLVITSLYKVTSI